MAKTGVVLIHSTPAALCPHIEWALASVLGTSPVIGWEEQPAEPGTLRAEFTWRASTDVSAGLASALRSCQRVRFEVTYDSHEGLGQRYSYTPALGMFSGQTMANGDLVVTENQITHALASARAGGSIEHAMYQLLGRPWDQELEPYRCQAPYEQVRWLHDVG